VLQPLEVAADVGLGAANITVITAGHRPPNPAALLESSRAAAILTELQEQFSLVLIDAPPTLVVSDAIPWIPRVSGVLVVGRLGHTTRASARRMHEQLLKLHASTLGVVLNGVKEPESQYYYAPAPATPASPR
jgi:Mrp family chromosome partitioning ATPase